MQRNQRFLTLTLGLIVLGDLSNQSFAEKNASQIRDVETILKKLRFTTSPATTIDLTEEYLQALANFMPDNQETMNAQFKLINIALDQANFEPNDDLRTLVQAAQRVASIYFSDFLNPDEDPVLTLFDVMSDRSTTINLLAKIKGINETKNILTAWLAETLETALRAAVQRGQNELTKGKLGLVHTLIQRAQSIPLGTKLFKQLKAEYERALLSKPAPKKQTFPAPGKSGEKKKWWQWKK